MKLAKTLRDKCLSIYVLTFFIATGLYTSIVYVDYTKYPDVKSAIIFYFCMAYVFLSGYILLKHYFTQSANHITHKKGHHPNDIVSYQEVRELVRYAAEHGIDKDILPTEAVESGTMRLNPAVKSYDRTILSELTQLITRWEATEVAHEQLTIKEMSQVILLYTKLNLFTPEHITGKTLCDSLKVDQVTQPIRLITWLIFSLIVLNVFFDGWFQDSPIPENGILYYLSLFQHYILEYISPYLWGAMGSCVYLLKIFSDLAENNLFNEDKLHGWSTRITLGALLGGVVQFIYDKSAFNSSGINLDANAIGFLTGISVKVVYGALEKTVEKLSGLMNLDSIKKVSTDNNKIRRYLNEKTSLLSDSEKDKNKRMVIQEIILELNQFEGN